MPKWAFSIEGRGDVWDKNASAMRECLHSTRKLIDEPQRPALRAGFGSS
jgi:hypothetical protein